LPGFAVFNTLGFANIGVQLFALVFGVAVFVVLTALAVKLSIRSFEKIDL
jgi:hypothetical protein